VTGLIVSTVYNAQTTLSGVVVILIACARTIALNYAMFGNPVAMKAVKTAEIHSWWYDIIARIDPAQRNSDPPRAYISVVNESSQRLFSSLTLCTRVSQR